MTAVSTTETLHERYFHCAAAVTKNDCVLDSFVLREKGKFHESKMTLWKWLSPCIKSLVKPGFYPGPSLVKKPGYPGS